MTKAEANYLGEKKKSDHQSKKGRKCKGEEALQFCRICYRPFITTYRNIKLAYISTENIFQVPQKKGLSKALASYLEEDLRFHLESGEQFSTHVSSPYGTKLELLQQLS